MPIPEGGESDSQWIEPEPPAEQVILQETGPNQKEPNHPPSLDSWPLLVQTNRVGTGATRSEHVQQPSAKPIMAPDWWAAYGADANTATERSSYLEGRTDSLEWPKGLRVCGTKLYFTARLLIRSSPELEYIV